MSETLQEYVDSRGLAVRVDAAAGVIRGVKILGLESRNGRSYLPEALARAIPLYEGARVNVNHPKGGPWDSRDYQDRLGAIRNVVLRPGAGLFGDLRFNPKHALAEQLVWDAEHAPENVGFSHNVEARTARRGERVVVEAITRVQSVDLVADPATTRGLFEAAGAAAPTRGEVGGGQAAETPPLADALTLEVLRWQRPDLVEELLREPQAEIERLRTEIDRLRLAEAAQARRAVARRLLGEAGLPDPDGADPQATVLLGEGFLQSLLSAADEPAMRQLVEERARLVGELLRWRPAPPCHAARPRSREQTPPREAVGPPTAREFVKAITC